MLEFVALSSAIKAGHRPKSRLKTFLHWQPCDGVEAEDSSYIHGNNNLLTVYPKVNSSEIT
jgi:hypothetical protein